MQLVRISLTEALSLLMLYNSGIDYARSTLGGSEICVELGWFKSAEVLAQICCPDFNNIGMVSPKMWINKVIVEINNKCDSAHLIIDREKIKCPVMNVIYFSWWMFIFSKRDSRHFVVLRLLKIKKVA